MVLPLGAISSSTVRNWPSLNFTERLCSDMGLAWAWVMIRSLSLNCSLDRGKPRYARTWALASAAVMVSGFSCDISLDSREQ